MDVNTKSRLKNLMEYHRGRKNVILRREIRQVLNIDIREDRQLRLLIGEIRRDKIDGLPILFATNKPMGYYVADNQKELDEGLNALRAVIKDECITLRDLKIYGKRFIAKEIQGVLV